MTLFNNWFRATQIGDMYRDVCKIAFYAGMEAAAKEAKDSPEIKEKIRDQIKRDTP
jgi:hypothetical protein